MNLMVLMNEIGDDADLLARSDEWLERERTITARKMNELAGNLRAIQTAQQIKLQLQQQNLVPLQQIVRKNGEISDIIIRIIHLPDALAVLDEKTDRLDDMNAATQVAVWNGDGYDVETSKTLR